MPSPDTGLDQNILFFKAPKRLDIPTVTGTRITNKVYKELKENDDDVRRAYFEFMVDDEAYVMDVRFKIKVTKERYLEWFATGS